MSYTITNTRNAPVALVNDNTLNSQTDLQLIGRSYTNFGIAFNKNLVKLMENFANPTAPANPLEGELWWNTTSKTLSVYNGSAWANIVPIADTITATNFNATYGNITNQNAGTINATNLYGSVIGNTGAALSGATLSLSGTSNLNTVNAVTISAGTIGNAGAVLQGTTIQSLGGGQVTGYLTGAIGANSANTGAFTTVTAASVTTTGGGQITGYLTGAIGANAANTGAFTTVVASGSLTAASMTTTGGGQLTGYLTGAIGANAANTGVFTTIQTNSIQTLSGGQVTGYLTGAIGANAANTGAFTTVSASSSLTAASVTTTSGGQITGYHTGAIGANGANTGAFTTITTSSTANIANLTINNGIYWANNVPFVSSVYSNANVAGYLPTYNGALTASSLTTLSGGQVIAYHTGPIGANGTNTGAFTTLTTSSTANVANLTINNGIYWANGVSFSTSSGNTFATATVTGLLTLNSSNGVTAIANGGTSGVGNIGASGATFNTVFAKATTAQYADVAEKYIADADYPAGTVVVFGGEAEITTTTISHDERVAGVISTEPAYLMNSEIHGLPVALLGRVPCRVRGPVSKGQMVVSSDIAGVAQALNGIFYTPGCIIGKSLETITDDSIQTIEVVVGRN